ncbi:MAG: NFACT family protein [Candidatus Obscuribacter sp.]|nr:NFACT family protein [Candidatus Obscuribacter sp.]
MQPFDALSIRAVLKEARPMIVNRRVDKVTQLGRDELLITLRGKTGVTNLFASAQSVHGRICLIQSNLTIKPGPGGKPDPFSDRYVSKYGANSAVPNFCLLLRKHLAGATLLAVEQPLGERIVDLVFNAVDEVGTASIKVLTAEIMGRHSNLILWSKSDSKIIAASHVVTKDMSRQREIAPGLRYERPPSQERPSLYTIDETTFKMLFEKLKLAQQSENKIEGQHFATVEQWIIATLTGAGRHLCEELVQASGLDSETSKAIADTACADKLWQTISRMRSEENYKPFMFTDLSRYSVLGLFPQSDRPTKTFPSVNDLIEEYFRSCEQAEQVSQLRDRLKADLVVEINKLESRIKTASEHVLTADGIDRLKHCGDLILANLTAIKPGQEILEADDIFSGAGTITVKLSGDLGAAQNAQNYYRQYAKARARNSTASRSVEEAKERRTSLEEKLSQVSQAKDIYELRNLKDLISGKKPQDLIKAKPKGKKSGDHRVISVSSSDGWTIYVGRNRIENDYLVSRLAQPNDLWFHVLGQGGAHVLIRIPSSKQDPPARTIEEAAQIAARFSKASHGSKVRVVYTQVKHVRKIANEKPGMVRYEQEKTVEVDTGKPMPKAMKQLFAPKQ